MKMEGFRDNGSILGGQSKQANKSENRQENETEAEQSDGIPPSEMYSQPDRKQRGHIQPTNSMMKQLLPYVPLMSAGRQSRRNIKWLLL
ncbi:hypothetical protein EYF80_000277 [Liparis tanakae]|uniref:Uncharacterized protein n=1 Tax=Liparis tanakae TaxID=230148 RepID=A0A4Z2JIT5_9TELE|nr:hypothetical protein EYF80_000277 [Liparis tanakae]